MAVVECKQTLAISSPLSEVKLTVSQPKFVVTIASKRHHIRFFSPKATMDADRAYPDGNPMPGTIVERDVTHPYEFDFCKYLGFFGTGYN
jgi:hypothetical protein